MQAHNFPLISHTKCLWTLHLLTHNKRCLLWTSTNKGYRNHWQQQESSHQFFCFWTEQETIYFYWGTIKKDPKDWCCWEVVCIQELRQWWRGGNCWGCCWRWRSQIQGRVDVVPCYEGTVKMMEFLMKSNPIHHKGYHDKAACTLCFEEHAHTHGTVAVKAGNTSGLKHHFQSHHQSELKRYKLLALRLE